MIKKNKVVELGGRGKTTLRPSDHIATGGEGSVYQKSNTVIKLYTDSGKMQRENLVDKIKILSSINHKFIVAPKGIVFDKKGKPIGFYMSRVSGEALPRIFTTSFRNRIGFDDKQASVLVDGMREVVKFAHNNKALLIDANEVNWLAVNTTSKKPEPRIIDVDSWAVGRWGASVVMPSIRDWHSKNFNQETDWFAWGVVTFQIYTGIHPYKGTLAGYKSGEMERRMKDNASVFADGVRLNRAVRDFSVIPRTLLDWYQVTFTKGERTIPPSPFDKGMAITQITRVMRIVNTASGNLIFDKIYDAGSDKILRIFPCGVALLQSGKLVQLSDGRDIISGCVHATEVIALDSGWLVGENVSGKMQFRYINNVSLQVEELTLSTRLKKIFRYENRLFGITERGLTEIVVQNLGKPILTLGQTWGALTNSTKWFEGVGVQDAFGAMYLIVPFGEKSCVQIRVRELDGLRPITAKAGNRFVTVIVIDKRGLYQKLEFTFDKAYQSYRVWQGQVDSPELNVAILPKGVCATIVKDGRLDVFVPSNGTLNTVKDKYISTDMLLANWNDKVIYSKNDSIWQVRMR